ncbi:uncharacterized protein LOC111329021 isoform X2 [Stylophora pistillata]|uniref:uncharacterized protein LOC111329021 isoform X2 n=1 Tax=Stylophora pistillata TaxID=50429 RepID=UPI000C03F1DA|nr:uncharacterized protein LOC111329021 isoform X2 [Stylophora pistillata]
MRGLDLPVFVLLIQNFFTCRATASEPDKTIDLDPSINPATLKMYDQEMEATFGELNLGMDYFEGDIKLTQQLRDYLKSSRGGNALQARALIKDERKLWANGVVPYALASDLSTESRGYINSAIKEWSDNTCLTLRPKNDADQDYIEFVYEVGCSSYVGRIGGQQTISVGNADGSITCKHGNLVHEIAHSLGFFHEHSRPDRDDYVEIKWGNIESGYQRNFEKETTETVDSREVEYDYGSVMHYGEFFFTKGKGLKTLEPIQNTDATIGQRVGLSDLDIRQGNLLYKCPGYGDDITKENETNQAPTDEELWDKPLREREIKVLRSNVHKKHAEKKSSHLHKILKKKAIHKKSTTLKQPSLTKTEERTTKHTKPDSRSMVFKENQLKPQLQKAYYQDDADVLEGDDGEDDVSYSRDVSSPVSAPETPNQLATDRATLAQEEEDAVQQQDSDEIGEENLGKDYFEGDMILTPDQHDFLSNIKKDDSVQQGSKRALIKDKMYLWPNAKVYYNFDKGVDRIGRRRARAAMRHWQRHTCLKFKRVKEPADDLGYINFVFEGGCASRVGRGGDKVQKLTIGSKALRCKIGNIIHELGHAVGFFHEHSRPDRNKYVRVLRKNILPGYERNFFRFGKKWIDSKDVPYDYGSIMHYNRAFFSRFPVMLDTLIPLRRVDIGQRKALSRFDILQANLLYQCDGRKKLTDEEIEQLKEESNDQGSDSEVTCADVYDSDSCSMIKTRGYCQKFPTSMRTTCGITCNLCGMNAKKKEIVHRNHDDTSLKRAN